MLHDTQVKTLKGAGPPYKSVSIRGVNQGFWSDLGYLG